MTIRLATAADLPLLAAIERSATELFSPDDLPPEHRGDTLPLDRLQHILEAESRSGLRNRVAMRRDLP